MCTFIKDSAFICVYSVRLSVCTKYINFTYFKHLLNNFCLESVEKLQVSRVSYPVRIYSSGLMHPQLDQVRAMLHTLRSREQ